MSEAEKLAEMVERLTRDAIRGKILAIYSELLKDMLEGVEFTVTSELFDRLLKACDP